MKTIDCLNGVGPSMNEESEVEPQGGSTAAVSRQQTNSSSLLPLREMRSWIC